MKIGNINLNGNLFLAPMAGVTDVIFRKICREYGADLTYTEMVSAKALMYDNEKTKELLRVADNEKPMAVQLFGRDKYILTKQAYLLQDKFDIIDLNMGCPALKIVKNGEGSALMLNPVLIGEIVKEISSNISKPLTVKIRKGFTDDKVNAVKIAKIIEQNGGSAITIHGRTREQFYSGNADWDIIKQVKKSVNIPVIGNGDVTDFIKYKEMLEYTNVDAVMIGRAAMGNPFIFKIIKEYLDNNNIINISVDEKVNLALRHAKELINIKGNDIAIKEMRKHFIWYTKGIKNSSKLRNNLSSINNFDDAKEILMSLKDTN